jgi:hypothetical protein
MMDSSDDVAEMLTLTVEVDQWGTRRYRNSQDELHRQHGPAVEYADGDKSWWVNGTRRWYLDGEHLTEGEFIMVTKYPSGNPVQQCESH